MDWTAIWLTGKLATCTTVLLFLFGIPISYWLATTRSRFRILIESCVALPLVLPPTVLGFYLLIATGRGSWFGRAYEQLTGTLLPFSFPGILLGSVLFNLPFAVRPFTAAFSSLDRKLIEASWCLGESKWRTFWRVAFPLSLPGIFAGIVLTFAHSVGEFGVVLMVGGNLPGVTRTLSVSIYDDVQALDYQSAGETALALVVFALIVLSLSQWAFRRSVPGV